MQFKDQYLASVGLDNLPASKAAEALELAHSLRRFEIELYWKRASYFWAFQAAALIALGLFDSNAGEPLTRVLLGPALFGLVTAFAGLLTAVGSKFWQDSWEAHVDLLEGASNAQLSKVVLFGNHARFSVTGVNFTLLLVLTFGWFALIAAIIEPKLVNWLDQLSNEGLGYLVSGVLLAVGLLFWWFGRSSLTGQAFSKGKWRPFRSGAKRPPSTMLVRTEPGNGFP